MRVLYERCCGLDVHRKTVVACLITPKHREVRSFGTLTHELLGLLDWLIEQQVTHVAMESAGVYWKPLWNLLEGSGLELLLVNASHMKAVPGRKTDVKDAEWIADLLRHGLLKPSFVPCRENRELRELVRYRRTIINSKSQLLNRVQKVLEGANIKLTSVISDISGKTGMAIVHAIAAGQTDAQQLAQLGHGRLTNQQARLQPALQGRLSQHQAFMLNSLLKEVDFLSQEIQSLDQEIQSRFAEANGLIERLDAIPGLGRRTVEEVLAEIGLDMSRFPSPAHLASWARLCPGNHESAGKRQNKGTGAGNPWLRSALVEAAWSAARTKKSYLCAQYHRLAARRGAKRASVAVAHSILKIIYHMICRGSTYQDLGANYFDERSKDRVLKQSLRRIERLGYTVQIAAT